MHLDNAEEIYQELLENEINCFKKEKTLQFSFDEVTNEKSIVKLLSVILKDNFYEFDRSFRAKDFPETL